MLAGWPAYGRNGPCTYGTRDFELPWGRTKAKVYKASCPVCSYPLTFGCSSSLDTFPQISVFCPPKWLLKHFL